MTIKQLSDAEYQQLAAFALKAAGIDGSGYTDAQIARVVGECKRVHRLLAVDGKQPEDLTPGEQIYAAAFKDIQLASVEEVVDSVRTGNQIPAVAVEFPAEPPPAKPNGKKKEK